MSRGVFLAEVMNSYLLYNCSAYYMLPLSGSHFRFRNSTSCLCGYLMKQNDSIKSKLFNSRSISNSTKLAYFRFDFSLIAPTFIESDSRMSKYYDSVIFSGF